MIFMIEYNFNKSKEGKVMDILALNKEQSSVLSTLANHAMSMYKVPANVRMELIEDIDTVDERNFVTLQACFANVIMNRLNLSEEVILEMIKSGKTHKQFLEFLDFVGNDHIMKKLEAMKEQFMQTLKEEKQA